MSTEHEIIDNIKKKYPDIPKDIGIQKEHRLFLRTDKENMDDLGFNFLVMVTAIDSIDLMDCAYFLGTFSEASDTKKVSVPSESPSVESERPFFSRKYEMLSYLKTGVNQKNILNIINCKNKR